MGPKRPFDLLRSWHHLCTAEPRARPSRRLAAWCSASRSSRRPANFRDGSGGQVAELRPGIAPAILPPAPQLVDWGRVKIRIKWIRTPRRRRGGCGAYSPPTTAVGSADRARRPHRSPPSTATDSITTLTSRSRCAMSPWPSSRRGASPWPARSSARRRHADAGVRELLQVHRGHRHRQGDAEQRRHHRVPGR